MDPRHSTLQQVYPARAENLRSHRCRVPRNIRGMLIAAVIGVAAMGLTTGFMLRVHAQDYRLALRQSLVEASTALEAFAVAELGDHRALLDFVAAQPPVLEAIADLTDPEPDPTAGRRLADSLAPLIGANTGLAVALGDGTVLFATDGTIEVDAGLLVDPPAIRVHVPALPSSALVSEDLGASAWLWGRIGPAASPVWLGVEADISALAGLLRSMVIDGATREIYFFDAEGSLLTPSRFEHQLVESGLLAPGVSSVGLRLADPGHNLLDQPGSVGPDAPLTAMAASAVTGESGVDIGGYRDYRG